jgi:hypothetical protein
MIWLGKMLCAYQKLPPLNRRFSAFEAIIATALPRTTPRNLSTSRLPLPSTWHAHRSNRQRFPRIDQMRVDRVRDNKIKESVRLSGYRSVADRE